MQHPPDGPEVIMSESNALYNWSAAWAAVGIAKRLKSNNQGAAQYNRTTPLGQQEDQQRTACIDAVRGHFFSACGDLDTESCLQAGGAVYLAQLAKQRGCGNCAEKVAVALLWLKEELGVLPLDMMELRSTMNIDHTFAVIGRRRGSRPDWPGTWGPAAVICDPWHDGGKAYYATQIEGEMYRGPLGARVHGPITTRSVYRVE